MQHCAYLCTWWGYDRFMLRVQLPFWLALVFLKTYIQECRQPIGKENECEKHLPPLTHSCRYIMILMFIAKANTSVCACDHARRNAPVSISLWNICTYLAESLTWGLVRDFRGIRQKGARFSYKNKSCSNFGASHHIATDKKIKKYIDL